MSKEPKKEIRVKPVGEVKNEIEKEGISKRDQLVLKYLIKCDKDGTHVQFTGIVECVKGVLTEDQVTKSRRFLIGWGLITKDNLNLNKERYRKLKKVIKKELEDETGTITNLLKLISASAVLVVIALIVLTGVISPHIPSFLHDFSYNRNIIAVIKPIENTTISHASSPDIPVETIYYNETRTCQDVEYKLFKVRIIDRYGNTLEEKTVTCSKSIYSKE